MKSRSTPHTATVKHKRVRVILTDGTVFIDRFLDRTKKHVLFAEYGKILRRDIQAFSIYEPLPDEGGTEGAEGLG